MLNQYIREAEKQTNSVGKLLERQFKLKTELQKELTEAETMAINVEISLNSHNLSVKKISLHLQKKKLLLTKSARMILQKQSLMLLMN